MGSYLLSVKGHRTRYLSCCGEYMVKVRGYLTYVHGTEGSYTES